MLQLLLKLYYCFINYCILQKKPKYLGLYFGLHKPAISILRHNLYRSDPHKPVYNMSHVGLFDGNNGLPNLVSRLHEMTKCGSDWVHITIDRWRHKKVEENFKLSNFTKKKSPFFFFKWVISCPIFNHVFKIGLKSKKCKCHFKVIQLLNTFY